MKKIQQVILINTAVFIFFILLITLFYYYRSILLPFFLAFIISYILLPMVLAMEKRAVPLPVSLLIVYVYIFLLFYAVFFFLLPGFWREIQIFITSIPELADKLLGLFLTSDKWLSLPDTIKNTVINITDNLQDKIQIYLESRIDIVFSVFNYIFSLVLAPVLTFYMLRDRQKIKKILISLLPVSKRDNILKTCGDIDHLLRQYLCGYLSVSLIVGFLTFIFLAILQVKYAMLFALIMTIGEFIPYFGPTLATFFAAAVTFIDNPWQAIYVLIALIFIQQLDNAIITPKIIGQRTGLHPLVVVFVVLAGGYSFGMTGMLLAVPFSAAIWLVFITVYNFLVAFKEQNPL